MDALDLIRRRIHGQHLAGERCESPKQVVARLAAMQAQEFAEAKWSIAERARPGLTDADVDAVFDRGEILRSHFLRPTWHFAAAEDIRWLLELTAPRVHALAKGPNRRLGLDERTLGRAHELLAEALAGNRALIRPELRERLAAGGIEGDGVRIAHVLMHAELEGLICSGPRRGKQHTYMLLAERAPHAKSLDREQALAELTRRYFTTRGPARPRDFSYWSGLTVADAKIGLELTGGAFVAREDDRGQSWFAPAERWEPAGALPSGGYLVPTYDELVMSYREMKVTFSAAPFRDGLLQRAIVIDGRTVGSWRRTLAPKTVRIEARLFGPLGRAQRGELQAAAVRFGAFLGLEPELEIGPAG